MDTRNITTLTPTDLRDAVSNQIKKWFPNAIAIIDYRAITVLEARKFINTLRGYTVADLATELLETEELIPEKFYSE